MQDDIPRLPGTERLILELLGSNESYGLELVSGSEGRLKRGTIYVTLGRMEQKGFVVSHLEEHAPAHGGLRRRLYTRTALGRRVMTAWTKFLSHLQPEFE
jgi:PadR family transcriptional regulator, regulatory protein PadR